MDARELARRVRATVDGLDALTERLGADSPEHAIVAQLFAVIGDAPIEYLTGEMNGDPDLGPFGCQVWAFTATHVCLTTRRDDGLTLTRVLARDSVRNITITSAPIETAKAEWMPLTVRVEYDGVTSTLPLRENASEADSKALVAFLPGLLGDL